MDSKQRRAIERDFTRRVLSAVRKAEEDGHDVKPSDVMEEIRDEMVAELGEGVKEALGDTAS
jgi:hypothetical protein